MPQIIKQGKPQEERYPYNEVLACQSCGCVFRLVPGDDYSTSDGDWREPSVPSAKCPDCGRTAYQKREYSQRD